MADLKKVTLPPPPPSNGAKCQIFKFRDPPPQKKKKKCPLTPTPIGLFFSFFPPFSNARMPE